MVSSFPKMQKSSASFSQSIRNRLRLKNLQAQAKNFCRVLDIRVPQMMTRERRQNDRLAFFLCGCNYLFCIVACCDPLDCGIDRLRIRNEAPFVLKYKATHSINL